VYVAPDGSYSAMYPSVRRRVAAGAIDFVLCAVVFLLASIVGGIVQGLGTTSLEAGDLGGVLGVVLIVLSQLVVAAPIVGYLAYYWAQGSTLGMRAVDIELVRDETGRAPGWRRTVPRACVAFLVGLAVVNAYFLAIDRPAGGYGAGERVLIAGSLAVAAAGLAAKAWMLVDGRRRSALDRLFGLVYVEELVFTRARPSPWLDGWGR
jgi:uncharacterized RDD family membrane protein YckC